MTLDRSVAISRKATRVSLLLLKAIVSHHF
jgi:hypothetical protein